MPLSMSMSSLSAGSQGLFSDDSFQETSVADSALASLQNEIMPRLNKLQNLFAESKHLFLSDDDRKMAKKYLDGCDKRTKELEVKIKNAQQLL